MRDDVEVVHINELMGGSETAAYLVRRGLVHVAPRYNYCLWFGCWNYSASRRRSGWCIY